MHGKPVLEAVRPSGVLRHVTADRAHHLAGRVRRVEQTERRGRLAHRQVRDARLDDRPPAHRVDLDDLAHPRHHDEDPVLARQSATRKSSAAAACHERHVVPHAFPDDRGGLLRCAGQNDEGREGAVGSEAVTLVGTQLNGVRDDIAGPADGSYPWYQCLDRLSQRCHLPVALWSGQSFCTIVFLFLAAVH